MPRRGNVPAGESARVLEEFKGGDVVRITDEVLADPDLELSPAELVRIGWPNEFEVADVFTLKGKPCLTLKPCCYFLEKPRGRTRCKGHDAQFFEKVRRERIARKGDRSAAVSIPWMGEVAGFRYDDDEESPVARFHLMGREVKVEGAPAKHLKTLLESYGVKI